MSRIARSYGWVLVVLGVGMAPVIQGADVALPGTVGRGSGVLAVQAGDRQPWRMLAAGEQLPDQCSLRSGAVGSSLIDVPGGSVGLGCDTRLDWSGSQRGIRLQFGRALLRTEASQTWSVTAGETSVAVAESTAAEVSAEAGQPLAVRVLEGSATWTIGGEPPVKVAAGMTAGWRPGDKAPQPTALDDDQRRRLAARMKVRPRPQGLGQLVVQDPQSTSPTRLNVARYHVHVVLQPPVALVQIDQSFYNPYGSQLEGTFVFSLPQGASVSRFAMYTTPQQLIEGELIERQQAANIYQSIVSRQRDPAILEQIGDHLFRMRVFPIFARDTKRILLDFTVPLASEEGRCRFRLPLLSDLKPIWDFQVSGVIKGPALRESVRSLSHPAVKFEQREQALAFQYRQQQYRPQSDFTLEFRQPTDVTASLRSHVAEPLPRTGPAPAPDDPWASRAARYFLATVPASELARGSASGGRQAPDGSPLPGNQGPDGPRSPSTSAAAADVLILADTSSGMRDRPALRQAVRTVVHNLRPVDRFRLVCVDVTGRPLHAGWVASDGKEAAAALAAFEQQFPLGGSDLEASFRGALSNFEAGSSRRRVVIYVGDGEDSLGAVPPTTLLAALAEACDCAQSPLFSIVVRDVPQGRKLLDSVSQATGGLVFDLVSGAGGNHDLLAWLLAGVPVGEKIVKVEVDGVAAEDLFFPTAWVPGRSLQIYGRAPVADRVKLRLTVVRQGQPQTLTWEFPPAAGDDDLFVGRLWAQRKLERLRLEESSRGSQDAQAQALRQRTIALSREWSLLSPHTAFLVLETEQDYRRWNIDRLQRRRYWRPAEAVPQPPLPADWLKLVAPDPAQLQRDREAKQLAAALQAARKALAVGHHSLAYGQLQRVARLPESRTSREYAELSRQARAGVMAGTRTESLGLQRGLFDPLDGGPTRPDPVPLPLLTQLVDAGPDFLERHPHYRQLLQEVDVLNPLDKGPTRTLGELASLLRATTKTNVTLDKKALQNEGVDDDARLRLAGSGKMSLRNYARFLLRQCDAVLLEEPHRLLITSTTQAETMLPVEIYPVGDVLTENGVPDSPLLVDPFYDRDSAAAERIRTKLQRPVSINFEDTPLERVVERFAELLDDTVLVDLKALDNVGVGLHTPIMAAWQNVPTKLSLRWILGDLGLAYHIHGEAVVITSTEEAEKDLTVQLHSGRGLVDVLPAPLGVPQWMGRSGGRRAFTMGGMGMGMGGGMGGLGGFFGGGMGAGGAARAPGDNRAVGMATPSMAFGGEEDAAAEEAETPDEPAAPMAARRTGPGPFVTSVIPMVDGPPGPMGWAQPWGGGAASVYDSDTVADLVTQTLSPQTWDSVGGPGSIRFFPPTLDFVFAQTDDVHEQVKELFDRLRRLPRFGDAGLPPVSSTPIPVPATKENLDFDTIIEVVTQAVRPQTWNQVGGAGSIERDPVHAALVIAQTQDVHDQVSQLLMLLRRSRYQAVKGAEPWKSAAVASPGPAVQGLGIPSTASELRRSQLPEPKADELAALAVRRVPSAGSWQWRRTNLIGGRSDPVRLRQAGQRLLVAWPYVVLRMEEDRVAAGYPGLGLVEHGHWAEAARQLVDTWLPWLPHRSNPELARLFDVTIIEPSKADQEAQLTRLRFVPPGQADPENTYIEAAFSKQDGLPRVWDVYLHGKCTGRFRFTDPADGTWSAGWRSVTLEDASGKSVVHWKLVDLAATPGELPELTTGWAEAGTGSDGEQQRGWPTFANCIHLDRRAERPALDPDFYDALEALRRADASVAVARLDAALKTHPQHPLLLLLKAWCLQKDLGPEVRREVLDLLKQVAAGSSPGVTRLVTSGQFPWLEPAEAYEVLSCQPAEERDAADWERLARTARQAGLCGQAFHCVSRALAADVSDGHPFERRRLQIELLLRLGKMEAAGAAAKGYSRQPDVTPEQLADLGELLATHDQRQLADGLLVGALERVKARDQRAALVRRRANVVLGRPRWDLLLEAASLFPADSKPRQECLTTLTGELTQPIHAEVAAALAYLSKEPQLQAALWVRQASLLKAEVPAADAAWRAFQTGQLNQDWFAWAFDRWNRAKQWGRVIDTAESWLRSGQPLPDAATPLLAEAYRGAGRPTDARRALTRDPEVPAAPPPPVSVGMSGGMF